MTSPPNLAQQRAIEALRAGVPNRDAVVALGCGQPEAERRFRDQLQAAQRGLATGESTTGLLVSGGFGTGKSHLLEHLRHIAEQANFVCSKIVIGKETPFYDPVKMFRSAIQAAAIPGRRGDAVTELTALLNFDGDEFANLERLVGDPEAGFNSRFAASLLLAKRLREPEVQHFVARFWAGEKTSIADWRSYLRLIGEARTFRLESGSEKELFLQRFRFLPRLCAAAGFAGWILFIDEVEMIGRYTITSRAKSYPEVARWMGSTDFEARGLASVLAINDLFTPIVLQEKNDLETVPEKLRWKGEDELARRAQLGMSHIQFQGLPLTKPGDKSVHETYMRVRDIHGGAYGWNPPDIAEVHDLSKATSTPLRELIKGWITEWDLRRLYPEHRVSLTVSAMSPDYSENADLQTEAE